MNIAVYCSARPDIPREFHEDATGFGSWIGQNGHTLVYGGLKYSMMDDVAAATALAGGKVMGIVPQSRIEDAHPANTVSLYVPDLHERKQMMEQHADIYVALEGGIGTLDEVFSAMASSSFFRQEKDLFLLDRDGLYQPLRQLLDKMVELRLVNPASASRFHFCPDLDSLINAIKDYEDLHKDR